MEFRIGFKIDFDLRQDLIAFSYARKQKEKGREEKEKGIKQDKFKSN